MMSEACDSVGDNMEFKSHPGLLQTDHSVHYGERRLVLNDYNSHPDEFSASPHSPAAAYNSTTRENYFP